MTSALLGFTLLSLLITMTPGSDTVLVLRNCLRGGRRSGTSTALGAAVGSLGWAVAVAFGLAAVLPRWDTAFLLVRIAGAGYLVFLGCQALWEQRRSARDENAAAALHPEPEQGAPGSLDAFRQGLFSCLLNPKVGIFFVAVVPQFLPHGTGTLRTTLLFGAIDAVVAGCWLSIVSAFATRALAWLRRPRVTSALERTVGAVLITLGLATAAESI